jgi:anti-sigma factor RsiW
MRCSHIQRLSTEYLDGELDPERSSAFRGHLRQCADCARRLEDEAAVRRAAEDLDAVIDPPAGLWQAIEERLAEAEIRDADRSPWILGWRRVMAALAPYRAHLVVAGGLAVTLLALGLKRSQSVEIASPLRAPLVVDELAPAVFAGHRRTVDPQSSQVALAIREIRRADRRYTTAIVELQDLVTSERAGWSPAQSARFDAAVAAFEARAAAIERRLEARPPVGPGNGAPSAMAGNRSRVADDPRARDPLYAVYREHIDYLQRAAFGDVDVETHRSPKANPSGAPLVGGEGR